MPCKKQKCLLHDLDYTWNCDRQYYFWLGTMWINEK